MIVLPQRDNLDALSAPQPGVPQLLGCHRRANWSPGREHQKERPCDGRLVGMSIADG
jgi:hypothetical protein